MSQEEDKSRLEAAVADAAALVARIRADNALIAEDLRLDPSADKREMLKRGVSSLSSARDALDTARAALGVFVETGSPHGLVSKSGRVTGTIAIEPKPGWSHEEREAAIEDALSPRLFAMAEELGVVLTTTPAKFTKERPGRDADGRLVLEVAGRVEGDRRVPAVSRAAKQMKR